MGPSSISTGPRLSGRRVHDFINDCDSAEALGTTQSFGPFSVFTLEPSSTSPSLGLAMELTCSEAEGSVRTPTTSNPVVATNASAEPQDQEDCNQAVHIWTPISNVNSGAVSDHIDYANPTPLPSSTKGSEGICDHAANQADTTSTTSIQLDGGDEIDATAAYSPAFDEHIPLRRPRVPFSGHDLPHWAVAVVGSERHLDKLADPGCEAKLIQHWVRFLCKNMVPFDSVHNLYRTIYLPFALRGLNSASTESDSNVALFHGLCAVAAESLLYMRQAPSDITVLLAARHDRMALKHLQRSIRHLRRDKLDSTLAAILICVMRDTVGGHARNWRGHVQGALRCLDDPAKIELRSGSNLHVVLEQFLGLATLGNVSTNYDIQALLSCLPEEKNYLTRQHGISKKFLESILMINKLSCDYYRLDPVLIDKLELQVYMSAPSTEPDNIYDDAVKASIAMHNAHVYYYAALIHFERMLRRTPSAKLYDLVSAGLTHLEAAEVISNQTNGSIWLWPCLVITTECSDTLQQTRALKWYRQKERHGFGNTDIGSKICVAYWAWRDENAQEALGVCWQSFVQGTGYDVVPL